jgi:hypothetical protein
LPRLLLLLLLLLWLVLLASSTAAVATSSAAHAAAIPWPVPWWGPRALGVIVPPTAAVEADVLVAVLPVVVGATALGTGALRVPVA